MKSTLAERFWSKVDKNRPTMPHMETRCNVWTACTVRSSSGVYGKIWVNGRVQRAHRIGYRLAYGVDPGELTVDHICHNTLCVNPIHLRLATSKQNQENLRGARRDSKSGVRGVYWHTSYQRWHARVMHNGKMFHAGLFDSLEDAEAAVTAKRNEPRERGCRRASARIRFCSGSYQAAGALLHANGSQRPASAEWRVGFGCPPRKYVVTNRKYLVTNMYPIDEVNQVSGIMG